MQKPPIVIPIEPAYNRTVAQLLRDGNVEAVVADYPEIFAQAIDDMMKRRSQDYERIKKRIQETCSKGNVPCQTANGTGVVSAYMMDSTHKVGYCRQGKVQKNTTSKRFKDPKYQFFLKLEMTNFIQNTKFSSRHIVRVYILLIL